MERKTGPEDSLRRRTLVPGTRAAIAGERRLSLEHVWPDRDDHLVRGLQGWGRTTRVHRTADRQHAVLCSRRSHAARALGGSRRTLDRRRRSGVRLSEPTGTDGRKIPAQSLPPEAAAANLPHGRLGPTPRDGQIEFHGRMDNQVKIRGFRIELGDIETQLTRHPALKAAVVVARGQSGRPASGSLCRQSQRCRAGVGSARVSSSQAPGPHDSRGLRFAGHPPPDA